MARIPKEQLYYWKINSPSLANAAASLTSLLDGVEGAIKENLVFERKMMYREAIAEVPYDTGRLLQSIRVFNWQKGNTYGVTATAFAVNPETGEEYSVEQHENPFYKHRNGRKYHYLSDPYWRMVARLENQIDRDTDTMVRQFESIGDQGETRKMTAEDVYGMAKGGQRYQRTRPGSVRYDRMWSRGKIYRGDPVHAAEMMAATSSGRSTHYKVSDKKRPKGQRAGYRKT